VKISLLIILLIISSSPALFLGKTKPIVGIECSYNEVTEYLVKISLTSTASCAPLSLNFSVCDTLSTKSIIIYNYLKSQ